MAEVIRMNGNRSLGDVVGELRAELRDFVQTRVEMLRAELNDKVRAWKLAAPMLAVAIVFAGVAFLCLTAALCAVIAYAIGWGWALVAVGLAYLAIAGITGWLGYREFTAAGVMPQRTLKVLKQDQAWLQSEAKSV